MHMYNEMLSFMLITQMQCAGGADADWSSRVLHENDAEEDGLHSIESNIAAEALVVDDARIYAIKHHKTAKSTEVSVAHQSSHINLKHEPHEQHCQQGLMQHVCCATIQFT